MEEKISGWIQKKRLGQVFLKDKEIAQKIVDLLDIKENETVLEIGPGMGILTQILLQQTEHVVALEKDKDLAFFLKQKFPGLKLIVGDALDFLWEKLKNLRKVIGNLPYYIASKLLWEIVSSKNAIEKMVFTVQKEVADKILAPVGSKKYGSLSVWIRHFSHIKYEFTISPKAFSPSPKVHSAVISIYPLKDEKLFENKNKFANLIKLCFKKRRKQIKNILKRRWSSDIESYLIGIGFDKHIRPERLSSEQFYGLSFYLKQQNKV